MNHTRYKLTLAVIGLLAAGPALAATLSVYAKMGGGVPTGAAAYAIGRVAPASGSAATTINCATNAVANCIDSAVATSAVVLLEPTLVADAQFVNWSGCTSVAGNVCTVSMTSNKTVTANFKPAMFQLGVKTYPVLPSPSLYGGVLTAPTEAVRNAGGPVVAAALDCRSGSTTNTVCSGFVPNGTPIVVTAVPIAGSKVTTWTGCSTSTATTCTIASMLGPKSVSASFGPAAIPLTAQVQGAGKITTPTTSLNPINCDPSLATPDCAGAVASGGNVTFTATPVSGYTFMGWTGACTGTATTCAFTGVTSAKTVTATFKSSSCTSCHGSPPSTHTGTLAANCANCHTGYTASTVTAATHMDGIAQAPTWNRTEPTANFGFNIEILAATRGDAAAVPAVYPTVDLRATDASGAVIDLVAAIAAGEFVSPSGSSGIPRIMFGEIQPDGSFLSKLGTTSMSTSDTMATTRLVDLGGGVYRYTLGTLLGRTPQVGTRSYRVATYGARFFKRADASYIQFPNYDWYDFVPDGVAPTTTPKMTVADAACDKCHGGLQMHGRRRGVQICLTCHNINMPLGTGNSDGFKWDLKNLAHKLHSGMNYVAGTRPDGATASGWGTTFDASHMAMGPSHTTYFELGSGVLPIVDPGIMGKECGVCHQGADAAFAFTKPTRLSCGSCHTETNFVTGAGHLAGIQANDLTCALCHPETLVRMYHSPFYETAHDADFRTLTSFPATGHDFQVRISGVSVNATTGAPTVTIQATLDGAAFDLRSVAAGTDTLGGRLATCAITIAGPTSDYTVPATGGTTISCTTAASLVATANAGEFTITSGTFFLGRTGAYTVGYEIMYQRVMTATNGDVVRKPFAAKPNFVTVYNAGTAIAPDWRTTERGSGSPEDVMQSRRAVVSFDKCNSCHIQLGFHSNRSRQGPDYCAECHNPKLDNGTRARATVAEAYTTSLTGSALVYLPESVSMNVFIHRIHMGEDLPSVQAPASASPWNPVPGKILYGATRSAFVGVTADTPPSISEFTAFAMPSPMGRCNQCHISDGATQTWALNERTGQAPVERTFRVCNATTPTWATEPWCNSTATSGMPTTDATLLPVAVKVITPPMKAACTSCHDSAAADAHADVFTISPMSAIAIESCAECHGAGAILDSLVVHELIP